MPARLRIHNQVCGPGYVIRSRPRHVGERLLAGLGIAPFRCQRCGLRFFRAVSRQAAAIWLGVLIVALGSGMIWILLPPALHQPNQAEARLEGGDLGPSLTLPSQVADRAPP